MVKGSEGDFPPSEPFFFRETKSQQVPLCRVWSTSDMLFDYAKNAIAAIKQTTQGDRDEDSD